MDAAGLWSASAGLHVPVNVEITASIAHIARVRIYMAVLLALDG
jgi:hypothetical protein